MSETFLGIGLDFLFNFGSWIGQKAMARVYQIRVHRPQIKLLKGAAKEEAEFFTIEKFRDGFLKLLSLVLGLLMWSNDFFVGIIMQCVVVHALWNEPEALQPSLT